MSFSDNLINWYNNNARDLPWRKTKDPYKIWVSEIILQQTRVAQGLSYYNSFIDRFPNVEILANASEEDVLNMWQGLGYYSRAINMHYTSKIIVNTYSSIFPSNYQDIKNLKGIGDYTAAAIASFCFNLPHAVVDGNVIRLLSRHFLINKEFVSAKGRKIFQDIAQKNLDIRSPGIYNQAVMELGALICTPRSPRCNNCPVQKTCKAYKLDLVDSLPIRKKRKDLVLRYFHYFIVQKEDSVYLRKRSLGIWRGMFEFPLIETDNVDLYNNDEYQSIFGKEELDLIHVSQSITHKLTHQMIVSKFYHVKGVLNHDQGFVLVKWNMIDKYPIPKLIEKYLKLIKKI